MHATLLCDSQKLGSGLHSQPRVIYGYICGRMPAEQPQTYVFQSWSLICSSQKAFVSQNLLSRSNSTPCMHVQIYCHKLDRETFLFQWKLSHGPWASSRVMWKLCFKSHQVTIWHFQTSKLAHSSFILNKHLGHNCKFSHTSDLLDHVYLISMGFMLASVHIHINSRLPNSLEPEELFRITEKTFKFKRLSKEIDCSWKYFKIMTAGNHHFGIHKALFPFGVIKLNA